MTGRILLIMCFVFSGILSAENIEKPKVFIDCSSCDLDFIRTEITFVNYVIDRKVADIFIMITSQYTGSGGNEFTLEFTGRNQFSDRNDKIKFITMQDDTSDIIRQKTVKNLKLGLVQYVSQTQLSDKINISFTEEGEEEELVDDWDSWVFTIGGNGYANGQKTYNSQFINAYLIVKRITDDWIFKSVYVTSHTKDVYEEYDYEVSSDSQNLDFLIVKSLNDHWSAGFNFGGSSSTYSNREIYLFGYPKIEYNLFPYSESNNKELRILYGAGYTYSKYYDTTIYNKNEEGLFKHHLEIALEIKKEWGDIVVSVTGSNYLYDFEKNRLDGYLDVSLNVLKGLSLNICGGYSMIHDQLSLAGGATEQEILLQKKEMETSYSYWTSVGLSYTFGSIYNNVVNPRFGN